LDGSVLIRNLKAITKAMPDFSVDLEGYFKVDVEILAESSVSTNSL